METFASSVTHTDMTGADGAARVAADQATGSPFVPSTPATVEMAFEQEWIAPWKALLRDKHQFDADDVIDPKELEGVDRKYWPDLIGLPNREARDEAKAQIKYELERQQALAEAGITGLAAQLVAGATDPTGIAISAVVGPGAAAGKLSRIAKAVRGFVGGAASNAAIESVLASQQYTRDPDNILAAALFGGAFGYGFGMLSRAENLDFTRALQDAATNAEVRAFNRHAGTAVQEAVAADRTAFGSVGAAAANAAPASPVAEKVANKINWLRLDLKHQIERFGGGAAKWADEVLEDATGGGGAKARMNVDVYAHDLHRTSFGQAKTELEDAYYRWLVSNKKNALERHSHDTADEFFTAVSREVRKSDPNASEELRDAANALRAMHNEYRKQMIRHGVEGAEDIPLDVGYLMRRYDQDGIVRLRQQFDDKEVVRLIEGAIRAGDAGMPKDRIAKIAKGVYKTLRQRHLGDPALTRPLTAADFDKAVKDLVDNMGMTHADAEDVVSVVHSFVKDGDPASGAMPRLKHKLRLDDTFEMELVGKDGKRRSVRFDEMLENDARVLAQLYSKQTAGHIAFAKAGYKNRAQIDAAITEALEEVEERGVRTGFFGKDKAISSNDVRWLKDKMEKARDMILGIPLHDDVHGGIRSFLAAVRDSNFARSLGQVGFAQAPEMMSALMKAGSRAMAMYSPAVREMWQSIRTGRLPAHEAKGLLRDMYHLGAFGSESALGSPGMRGAEDLLTGNVTLRGRLQRGVEHAKRVTAKVSMLEAINAVFKPRVAATYVQGFADLAHGVKKVPEPGSAEWKRLLSNGIAKEELDWILKSIKRHGVVNKDGILESLDVAAMKADNPDFYDAFKIAVGREVDRTLQEPTVGEKWWFSSTMLGQIITQFRGFGLAAFGKQTLYGLHHMDPQVAAIWFMQLQAAMVAYGLRMSLNYAGSDKLEEKLQPDEFVKSAFQNASWVPMMAPLMIDTLADMTGHDPVFRNQRTSNMVGGAILGNPTFDAGSKAYGLVKTLVGLPQSDQVVTQKAARDAARLLLPNLLGIQTLINNSVEALPSRNPYETYQPSQ